jgi:hypothetical protein
MKTMYNRIKNLDPLMVLILSAVLIAIIFPADGRFAEIFALATKIAVAVLFFLYGARLSTTQALDGLKNWKLHLVILGFTFIVFPLIGLALAPVGNMINPALYLGVLYLTLVPSTVQSSVAFTSISGGNVAGAIVSASASNLVGVIATPLLVMALMSKTVVGDSGVHIDASVFMDIALQLFFPFILGQVFRPWIKTFAANKATKIVDRGSITMVVYSAFSAGVVDGIWTQVNTEEILGLCVFSVVLVAIMLWLSKATALRLGFGQADMKAIQFCGSKKSLATGLPMAAVIFGGANIGLLILPLMVFHQIQLMMCSWLAARYAKTVTT